MERFPGFFFALGGGVDPGTVLVCVSFYSFTARHTTDSNTAEDARDSEDREGNLHLYVPPQGQGDKH
jgi:hypothetical protein